MLFSTRENDNRQKLKMDNQSMILWFTNSDVNRQKIEDLELILIPLNKD